jgi:LCP family protein required for cell wall assembly
VRPTATPIDPTSLVGKLRSGKPVSLILIGYGGEGHDGAYLTDALVVAHFDPRVNQLTMFNLPRDLMVQPVGANGRPAGTFRRINEIYSAGLGPAAYSGQPVTAQEHDRAAWLTAAAAQVVLGFPIDGWVSADFDAVRRVVDGLGGVTVNVETAFDDYSYPRHDNPAIDPGIMHIHFDAGPQRLTGERALQYARSRYATQDGTDFGRSRRQQRLLVALKDEAVRPETLPKIFTLMDALQGHLRTSLSLDTARDLVLFGRERDERIRANSAIIDSRQLLTGITTEGGASVLIPRAGYGSYTAIHQFVRASIRATSPDGANQPR